MTRRGSILDDERRDALRAEWCSRHHMWVERGEDCDGCHPTIVEDACCDPELHREVCIRPECQDDTFGCGCDPLCIDDDGPLYADDGAGTEAA